MNTTAKVMDLDRALCLFCVRDLGKKNVSSCPPPSTTGFMCTVRTCGFLLVPSEMSKTRAKVVPRENHCFCWHFLLSSLDNVAIRPGQIEKLFSGLPTSQPACLLYCTYCSAARRKNGCLSSAAAASAIAHLVPYQAAAGKTEETPKFQT